ncbi:hypothetical protein KAFR_0D04010 [Kazachstania africana CBS 2517]|uniref:PH domain-containing protein n=1 Tax=Kazachstania africana (strain ATCC 22294 / BCRC 22015 / CBS 2517 / CECT 1963 / NBRC 1671 / NRRL Y-8276) TaxID=1071382 RepID=H2AUJ9_KAZAF|nr:hypothetical protein KAFR_0D04010 [Kazachstania africana CBS 2517]CCF58049.1 hypothetical protein KAFR_0D04010 [Kazachstania africana CBS 2517]
MKRIFSGNKSPKLTVPSNSSSNNAFSPSSSQFSSHSDPSLESLTNTQEYIKSGQLSEELVPMVTLLSSHAHRRYHEGVLLMLHDLKNDGSQAGRVWKELYAVLIGTQLALWPAKELAGSGTADLKKLASKPTYINFMDATIKSMNTVSGISEARNKKLENSLVVSTTLKNRYFLQFSDKETFAHWTAAIRLSLYECRALQEAYTGAFLSSRGAKLSDIRVILASTKFDYEDWVSVRFGTGMPWKRCYAVITQKKGKKKDTFGQINFYEDDKKTKKKNKAMITVTAAQAIYAVYPSAPQLIDDSTIIKLEGTITIENESSSQTSNLFIMPERHNAVAGYDTIVRFLIPAMNAFKLYGRPTKLISNKDDPNSLLFALPVLPHVYYLDVDDLLVTANSSPSTNWDGKDWDRYITDLLQNKCARGYSGCGSTAKLTGAISSPILGSAELFEGSNSAFNNKLSASPTFGPYDRMSNASKSNSSLPKTSTKPVNNSLLREFTLPESSSLNDSQKSVSKIINTANERTNDIYPRNDSHGDMAELPKTSVRKNSPAVIKNDSKNEGIHLPEMPRAGVSNLAWKPTELPAAAPRSPSLNPPAEYNKNIPFNSTPSSNAYGRTGQASKSQSQKFHEISRATINNQPEPNIFNNGNTPSCSQETESSGAKPYPSNDIVTNLAELAVEGENVASGLKKGMKIEITNSTFDKFEKKDQLKIPEKNDHRNTKSELGSIYDNYASDPFGRSSMGEDDELKFTSELLNNNEKDELKARMSNLMSREDTRSSNGDIFATDFVEQSEILEMEKNYTKKTRIEGTKRNHGQENHSYAHEQMPSTEKNPTDKVRQKGLRILNPYAKRSNQEPPKDLDNNRQEPQVHTHEELSQPSQHGHQPPVQLTHHNQRPLTPTQSGVAIPQEDYDPNNARSNYVIPNQGFQKGYPQIQLQRNPQDYQQNYQSAPMRIPPQQYQQHPQMQYYPPPPQQRYYPSPQQQGYQTRQYSSQQQYFPQGPVGPQRHSRPVPRMGPQPIPMPVHPPNNYGSQRPYSPQQIQPQRIMAPNNQKQQQQQQQHGGPRGGGFSQFMPDSNAIKKNPYGS